MQILIEINIFGFSSFAITTNKIASNLSVVEVSFATSQYLRL